MSADAEYVRANSSRCRHDLFFVPSYQSDALCVVEGETLTQLCLTLLKDYYAK